MDAQMAMKYVLPCSLAVLEPYICSLRCRDTRRDTEQLRVFIVAQYRKVTDMPIRDYEGMIGIDELMIKKSRAEIILINHAGFNLA
jgi:hypothetical protein